MTDPEVKNCIEIHIERIILDNTDLSSEQVFEILMNNPENNPTVKYCLSIIDKNQIIYMIHRNLKSKIIQKTIEKTSIKSTVSVHTYAEKVSKAILDPIIEFKDLCQSLGIEEEVPQYEVYHNKQICEFVESLNKQGFRTQWRSCPEGSLKLFLFPNT